MFVKRCMSVLVVMLILVGALYAGNGDTVKIKCDGLKLVVSAYEYNCNCAHKEGKLQHLYINEKHNNKTVLPGGSLDGIAKFPYGEKLLLVATVDLEKLGKDCVEGIRWSFMETAKKIYGDKPGVEVSIIKGAGVPEDKVPTSADQIITKLGVGPVYPPLPQTVVGLKSCSGEPVDSINIKPNQSWVIIRSFEPGVSKVLVSIVTGKNVVSPEVEYAVNWINKCKPICQTQKLQVNVVEAAGSPDPFVFTHAHDQHINYRITVTDISDYYQNPHDDCVLPLLYPDICYRLRFRIDPLQQPNPPSQLPTPPWPDAYWVDWGVANNNITNTHQIARLTELYEGAPPHQQIVVLRSGVITPRSNGASPGADSTHDAYVVFYTCIMHSSTFFYFEAWQRSVDASVAYSGTSCKPCKKNIPAQYNHITDESTTIEYQPDETIGGLAVTWDPQGAPGPNTPVHLVNTGGMIYEIFGEHPNGQRWFILKFLAAGNSQYVSAHRGDWIYYHTISVNNVSGAPPIIAEQRKVRVQ